MISGWKNDEEFMRGNRTLSYKYKKFSWVFGKDAMKGFLGKSPRQICLELGFSRGWIEDRIRKGKIFKFAIFPSQNVGGPVLNDWDGLADLLQEFYKEVWPKIARHLPDIRVMSSEDLQAEAGYDMFKAHLAGRRDDTTGESDDPNYMSLQRLVKREGTRVEVRQFLWDELGVTAKYTGTGHTLDESGKEKYKEYWVRNTYCMSEIEGCAIEDVDPSK